LGREFEWAPRRIGDFAQRLLRVNVEGKDLPPFSVTKGSGVMLQSEKYKKRIATDPRKYVLAEPGDFVYDPMSLYYGSVGLVPEIGVGLASPDYVVFKTDDSVSGRFLHYLLRSPRSIHEYQSLAEGGNQQGKRRRIYWSVLREHLLLLPPLAEQRKIAAILSSVDEAIEASRAVIGQLQVVKKAMMAGLLTRGLPGRHARFKQTEIGEVPEGWHIGPLQQFGQVDCGKARNPRDSGRMVPYLRVANVFDGEIRLDDVLEMPFSDLEISRFELRPRDVLLNEGQSLQLVGRCSMYRDELARRCAFQNALLRFRETGPLSAEFAEQHFRWCQSSGRFADMATQTTSIAHLGLSRFANMVVAVPPLTEQAEIAATLGAVDERVRAERRALTGLSAMKTALMSTLLTGEVRVEVHESSTGTASGLAAEFATEGAIP